MIGKRINPTDRKKLAAELEVGNFSTVEKDALQRVAFGTAAAASRRTRRTAAEALKAPYARA